MIRQPLPTGSDHRAPLSSIRLGARTLIQAGSLLLILLMGWFFTGILPAEAGGTLTVVRQTQAGQNWSRISQQLQHNKIAYQVIDATDLTDSTLTKVRQLFLPNIGELTATQATALTTWLQTRQGQVIVSGSLQVPPEQQVNLQTLLGSYWRQDLAAPATPTLTELTNIQWAKSVTSSTAISGGSLIPTDPGSRLIATWSSSSPSPPSYAVIATRQSVYLGWRWGEIDGSEAQDQQWLQAALDRNGAADTTTQAPAPPTQPVNTFEMLSMRKELQSLLGRVESALLVTRAARKDPISLSTEYEQVLLHANAVVKQLPNWVSNGEFLKARQEFEQARADLWKSYPVDRLTTLPEVRAIWLDRGTIVDARSESGLKVVFDRLAQAGINTVFFETINAGFPIYPSRIAPQQNPLTRGWDPLAAAVRLAHERQMELHAWMWTFAVGNKRHNILPAVNLPESYPGPVLTLHPDWANVDNRGNLFPPGQKETWLDPANPAVRAYLLALMREMVQDYKVDGIQLDYIRYPFQNPSSRATFGYGAAARQQFQQLTGVDPVTVDPQRDPSLFQLWTQFRVQQVSQFVATASDTLRQLNPNVILSTAVYAFPTIERIQKIQQDWEAWVAAGNIDLLVPMTYTDNTRRLAQLVEPNLEIVNRSPVLFLPSLNLLDLPAVEFLDQMQVIRDLPTGGYSLFAARHLNDTLQKILSQSAISSSQIPYRNPLGTAQARFQSLTQEWKFLLDQGQLAIGDTNLALWMKQNDALSKALDQAAQPGSTPEPLKQAQSLLSDLIEQFPVWLKRDTFEHPYRGNTWQNRLNALEIFLRYAEQGRRTVKPTT